MDIAEAGAWDLLAALRVLGRQAEHLTRGRATEVRHVLYYLAQDMGQLRGYVVTEQMRWTTAAAELEDYIGRLEALRAYVAGEGGVPWNRNEIGGVSVAPGVIVAEVMALRPEP